LALKPFDLYMDPIDLAENVIANYTLFWFGTLIGGVENEFPIQRFFLLVKCVEYSSFDYSCSIHFFDWIITFDFFLKHQFLTFELGGINCIFTFQRCASSLKILFILRFPTFGTMHFLNGYCLLHLHLMENQRNLQLPLHFIILFFHICVITFVCAYVWLWWDIFVD
jgi:hypothetical protein